METTPSYMILSMPLCKLKESAKILYDETNNDIVQIIKEKVTFSSLQRNVKEVTSYVPREEILQCKLSPKRTIFGSLTANSAIVFSNIAGSKTFNFHCRDKCDILGFYWIADELVMILTTYSIEILHVKTSITLIKSIPQPISFYKYSPEHRILLVSQESSHVLYPYRISENPIKLNKIQLWGNHLSPEDVMITTFYDHCFVVHACLAKQEIIMYKLKDDLFAKESSMNLFALGQLQYSVVDSLFVVHNTMTKLSMIYDVACKYENPLTFPAPIANYEPYTIQEELKDKEPTKVSVYSDKWRYLNGNLILDLESGFVFELHITLSSFPFRIKLKTQEAVHLEHVKFLSRRIGGKSKLLESIRKYSAEKSLSSSIEIFSFVVRVYLQWIMSRTTKDQMYDDEGEWSYVGRTKGKPEAFSPNVIWNYVQNPGVEDLKNSPIKRPIQETDDEELNLSQSQYGYTVLDQQEMYKNVFCELEMNQSCSLFHLFSLCIEYIRCLRFHNIPVSDYITRLAIEVLIKDGKYNMLHQYIQYKIITDSRNIALQILSIEDKYKPAFQIGMDMLIRLGDHSVICETLIARKKIGHALSVMHNNSIKTIPFKIIFERIVQLNDDLLFFNAFEILKKIQGSLEFCKRDDMEEYIKLYREKFGADPK
jgi:hypothetical protein